MDHEKRLEEIKRQNYYRENVKRRNVDILEEKKSKAIWRLEKIDLKNS